MLEISNSSWSKFVASLFTLSSVNPVVEVATLASLSHLSCVRCLATREWEDLISGNGGAACGRQKKCTETTLAQRSLGNAI